MRRSIKSKRKSSIGSGSNSNSSNVYMKTHSYTPIALELERSKKNNAKLSIVNEYELEEYNVILDKVLLEISQFLSVFV